MITDPEPAPPRPPSAWSLLVVAALRKRRTWVAFFFLAYAVLVSSTWNVLVSIRTWHNAAASSGSWWPAMYASVLYGVVFGVLSMAATAAVAVPATVVTWITVLVLLAFAGKTRNRLVTDGRKITGDIAGIAFRILIREGNMVAAACATVSFFVLLYRRSSVGD